MNVYDFDKTIFYPDSSYSFFMYCLRAYPAAVLRTVPELLLTGIKKLFHCADTRVLKEKVFSFLQFLPDAEKAVSDFWLKKLDGIGQWYIEQRRDDDLIISASPEFLVRPAAEYLHIALIATPMDIKSGKILGLNCHDSEKVRRFLEAYPSEQVDEFYSDSLSDSPMADLSKRAFLVKRGKLMPWPAK